MGELILGTAQLGQAYGIANRTGQPDVATAHAIIETAWRHGVRSFDTAPSYGNAERVLGDALRAIDASHIARVVTKLELTGDVGDPGAIAAAVARSRGDLSVPRLAGLLVRRTLLGEWASVRPALQRLVADGVIERVGVSVYTPDEAFRALALDDIAFIQVPTSILDRRFLAAGVFDQAQAIGKQIVVRSVFLQGLLTMHPEDAPSIPGARAALEGVHLASGALGMSPIALALAYVRERCPDADILVGAETPEQVAKLATFWQQPIRLYAKTVEQYVSAGAESLVDPTRWPTTVYR